MHELPAESSHLMQEFVKTENEITIEKLVLQKTIQYPILYMPFYPGL